MKSTIVSAILLIFLMVLVGCTGLPPISGQTGVSNPADQEASARATFIAERGGGDMMVTQGGGDGMMFNGTIGTISAIESAMQRITVAAPDRTETIVALAEGSTITQQAQGTRDDLHLGDQVTVVSNAEGAAIMVQMGEGGMSGGTMQRPVMVPAGSDPAAAPATIQAPISGTITNVDGDTLTVTPSEGDEAVDVQLTAQTMIEKNEILEFAALTTGMTVSVIGEPDEAGTIQAQYLMVLPEGMMTMPRN